MNLLKQIDKFTSERLKQRCITIGLSQKELGETLRYQCHSNKKI